MHVHFSSSHFSQVLHIFLVCFSNPAHHNWTCTRQEYINWTNKLYRKHKLQNWLWDITTCQAEWQECACTKLKCIHQCHCLNVLLSAGTFNFPASGQLIMFQSQKKKEHQKAQTECYSRITHLLGLLDFFCRLGPALHHMLLRWRCLKK